MLSDDDVEILDSFKEEYMDDTPPVVWRYEAYNATGQCVDGLPYHQVYDEEVDEWYDEPIPGTSGRPSTFMLASVADIFTGYPHYPLYLLVDDRRFTYCDGALYEETETPEELVWDEKTNLYRTRVVYNLVAVAVGDSE